MDSGGDPNAYSSAWPHSAPNSNTAILILYKVSPAVAGLTLVLSEN